MPRSRSPSVIAAVTGVLALIDSALARGERPVAPAFAIDRLGGEGRGSLADYRGEVVVLNSWGSWCSPCRDESPLLQRWHERLSPRGGTVLGVDVTSDAHEFAREYGLTYPMLKDTDESLRPEYGITGYPETFVIDRRGRITALRRGPVDERFMREEVLPLVEERQ